ncbi:MAG: GNAT family N-acetyltransferase [Patescibacteria group bacterium]
MINIRLFTPKDLPAIKKVLAEADLSYPNIEYRDFWVAEQDNQIVGVLQLENKINYSFLSSLGVFTQNQNQGIASKMLQNLMDNASKDVYLYTIIPRFFEKHGFKIALPPPFIPPRSRFDCMNCEREKCVCMVKKAKDKL